MVKQIPKMGNLDPSRFLRTSGGDTAAAGHDDPAGPHRSADDGGWRRDAAGVAHDRDTRLCSTAARDRSTCRSKTSTRNLGSSKTAAGEQLPSEPPSQLAGGF